MNYLTRQQLFDNAYLGIKQYGLSFELDEEYPDRSNCRYRLDKTAECPVRCGVGHSIPDDQYESIMENKAVGNHEMFDSLFDPDDVDFLTDLQDTHDDAVASGRDTMIEDFFSKMVALANKYHLTVPDVSTQQK